MFFRLEEYFKTVICEQCVIEGVFHRNQRLRTNDKLTWGQRR